MAIPVQDMDTTHTILLADLVALSPTSYVIRALIAISAFGAAMNIEKVVARVIGFAFLLVTGTGLLLVGIDHGTVVDIVAGAVLLCASGYSWWYTRV